MNGADEATNKREGKGGGGGGGGGGVVGHTSYWCVGNDLMTFNPAYIRMTFCAYLFVAMNFCNAPPSLYHDCLNGPIRLGAISEAISYSQAIIDGLLFTYLSGYYSPSSQAIIHLSQISS